MNIAENGGIQAAQIAIKDHLSVFTKDRQITERSKNFKKINRLLEVSEQVGSIHQDGKAARKLGTAQPKYFLNFS